MTPQWNCLFSELLKDHLRWDQEIISPLAVHEIVPGNISQQPRWWPVLPPVPTRYTFKINGISVTCSPCYLVGVGTVCASPGTSHLAGCSESVFQVLTKQVLNTYFLQYVCRFFSCYIAQHVTAASVCPCPSRPSSLSFRAFHLLNCSYDFQNLFFDTSFTNPNTFIERARLQQFNFVITTHLMILFPHNSLVNTSNHMISYQNLK